MSEQPIAEQSAEMNQTLAGLVFKKSTGLYHVRLDDGAEIVCTISTKLRKNLIYPSRDRASLGFLNVDSVGDITLVDPVAVGDEVAFWPTNPGEGHIVAVAQRHSKLTRRAAGEKPLEQVIVANPDQMVIVMASTQPKPKWRLLDRYLASAEASGLEAAIVFTKRDLIKPNRRADHETTKQARLYRSLGYTVLLTSATTGENVDSVRDLLAGNLSAFVGMSGVGKTTLLNAVQPELGLKIGAINETISKGRHTTTHLEMFSLDNGGYVVDTPGTKTFGLWAVEQEDVGLLFREIAPLVGTCKFGLSCQHETEPGCAVLDALEHGDIAASRYDSYLHLRDNLVAAY